MTCFWESRAEAFYNFNKEKIMKIFKKKEKVFMAIFLFMLSVPALAADNKEMDRDPNSINQIETAPPSWGGMDRDPNPINQMATPNRSMEHLRRSGQQWTVERDPPPSRRSERRPSPEPIGSSLNQENCSNYENNMHVSLLGENSWLKPLSNCVAYNIDKGLAPICKLEEEAKDILAHTDNRDGEELLEEFLLVVEEEKAGFVDYISEILDNAYTICDDIKNLVEDERDYWKRRSSNTDSAIYRLNAKTMKSLGNTSDTECQSFYRSVDIKVRNVCKGLNFSDSFN